MQSYPVDLLGRMLEIYSPSGRETELSGMLFGEMESNGLVAKRDSAGNIIGQAGQYGPHILLCGHMDTVIGKLPVTIEDGFIRGRGAVDAKASLASMIVGAAKALQRNLVPFQVTIAGVVEEETTSKGISSIASDGAQYDLAVFGEPSGISNIIIGYKGSLKVEITCQTPGGHSSSPWLAKNSLEEAFEFWKALRETVLENNASSRFDAITGSVVNSTSGPGGNSIPNATMIQVDVRIPPRMTPRELVHTLEFFKSVYLENHEGVKIDLKFADETRAYLGPDDSIGVRAFRYAIRKNSGRTVSLVRKTGTSDMNTLAQTCAAPMIAYGPGDSSLDHTEFEKVSIAEYLESIEVYASAIERFATLAAQPLKMTIG